jgi:hypothetical protein
MDARDQFFGRGGDRKQQLSETESWVLIKWEMERRIVNLGGNQVSSAG